MGTSLIKLRLECTHLAETRIFYDAQKLGGKHNVWVGKTIYCPTCHRIKKVTRVEGRK